MEVGFVFFGFVLFPLLLIVIDTYLFVIAAGLCYRIGGCPLGYRGRGFSSFSLFSIWLVEVEMLQKYMSKYLFEVWKIYDFGRMPTRSYGMGRATKTRVKNKLQYSQNGYQRLGYQYRCLTLSMNLFRTKR